jgi:hypothetical protein
MSPRATSTEEPDGGNLLVRIWRGAGVGNLPAYSTTRIGKSNGIFTSVSTGAHPRSPRRLDATAPRCPTACACKAARWLWRATSAMADAAPSAWPAFFGLPHPR